MIAPDIQNAELTGKKILLRADLDVPLAHGQILDDARLKAALPTIAFLAQKGATVYILGHLGRPKGQENAAYSLVPVAKWLGKNFQSPNDTLQAEKFGEFTGWRIGGTIVLLENVRFYKGEEANDPSFAQSLASLGDIYVNDAFAVAHRKHASTVGVSALLPHYAGLRLQQEVQVLGDIVNNPNRPLVVIIGGAKIETKLPLVERMHQFADYVLVGGKIAQETRTLLQVQHSQVEGRKSVLLVAELQSDTMDITAKSAENFIQIINLAQTVVWNGPVGYSEEEASSQGSLMIAQGIIASGTYSVVGGGDTVGFLKKHELLDKFSFVSMGGGAMLAFLSGDTLAGIAALSV